MYEIHDSAYDWTCSFLTAAKAAGMSVREAAEVARRELTAEITEAVALATEDAE